MFPRPLVIMVSTGVLAVLAGLVFVMPSLAESALLVAGGWFFSVVLFNLLKIWAKRSQRERVLWLAAYLGGMAGWIGLLLQYLIVENQGGPAWVIAQGMSAGFGLGIFWGMGLVPQTSANMREAFLFIWPFRASLGLLIWTSWLYFAVIPVGMGASSSVPSMAVAHSILAVIWLVCFVAMTWISPTGYWRQSYLLLTIAATIWHTGLILHQWSLQGAISLGILAMGLVILGLLAKSKARSHPTNRRQHVGAIEITSFMMFWGAVFLPMVFHILFISNAPQEKPLVEARTTVVLLHTCIMAIISFWLWFSNKRYIGIIRSTNEQERDTNRKVHELLETQILEKSNKLDQTQYFLEEEISLRRKLEDMVKKRDKRYEILVETMNEGLGIFTKDMDFSYVNDALCQMLEYSSADIVDRPMLDFFDHENKALIKAQWEKQALGFEEPYEVVWTSSSGKQVVTQISPRIIRDDLGDQIGSFAVVTDVTERKRVENELRIRLQYDPLTGLVNRTLFMERLDRALLAARRDAHNVAVLILDLDRFKRINDSLGHDMGDALLAAVGKRLTDRLDAWDTVSRLAADEFGLIITNIDNPMELVAKVEQIQTAFNQPFSLRSRDVTITSSIGISIWPSDGHSAQVLVNNADAAVYHAKNMGRNGYQFYTDALNKAAFQRLEIENQLRRAFDRNELVLHYQPKVDLRTGKAVGVEALVRWQHPEKGFLSPNHFIPVAEETGLIGRLSDWLMEEACRQAKVWQESGNHRLTVGINVSANQFSSEDLVAKVVSVLAKTQLDPEYLELEITESMAMENVERSISILEQLKTLGVRVALDDFGTGHASLNYLKRFCFRSLKVDRCFIMNADTDPVDAAIVRAVIQMGHGLGLEVIAEGVENRAQLEFLAAHGCDQIQGYYISQPVSPASFDKLLAQESMIPKVPPGS